MTMYHSLFGGTTTDTQIQVAKENQIVIGYGPGMRQSRYVIYKIEHRADGYMYHMADTDTKEIRRTDMLSPLSQKFGIGLYYTDTPAEFMDAFEVAALAGEAERKAQKEAQAQATAKAEHDRIARIGAERLERLMPDNVQGVILAELNKTKSDHTYDYRETSSIRTVILGFSTTTRNGFGELRKAARNLPETAHLAEYNKDYEHRYPGFTLGKSPYSGWSIHKLSHYTRKGFIDTLAYTAGNEDNIRLNNPKPERTRQEQKQTTVKGDFTLVDYSEKAIALFGDTKPIKDALSDLGGRFNSRLTHDGQKRAGWIFQKAKEAQVRELIGMTE